MPVSTEATRTEEALILYMRTVLATPRPRDASLVPAYEKSRRWAQAHLQELGATEEDYLPEDVRSLENLLSRAAGMKYTPEETAQYLIAAGWRKK